MAPKLNTRKEARKQLAEYLKAHPEVTYSEISVKINCAISTIASVAREYGIKRQRKALDLADLQKLEG